MSITYLFGFFVIVPSLPLGLNAGCNFIFNLMDRYNFKLVEKKWQEYWEKNKSFVSKIDKSKNLVIGFGITQKTISKFKKADGLVVGSEICKEITYSLNKRQNPVTNVSKLVNRLRKKIL